jgi:hypothetical protein
MRSHSEDRMDFVSPAELARQQVEGVHDADAVSVIPRGTLTIFIDGKARQDPLTAKLHDAVTYDESPAGPIRVEYREGKR